MGIMKNESAGNVNNLPRKIEKPWGFEILFAETPRYAGKVLFVRKDCRLSLQYHKVKDEALYVYEGKVNMEIERDGEHKESLTLGAGDCVRITPLTRHRLTAIEDTTLFEASTPELDDVVRLDDDYGRIGR
jgi:mannose-6-phosphate isomerase-like protein (cupin superfamily)